MTDRLWYLATAIAALYAIFLLRLFQLQVVDGARYAQLVEQSRLVHETMAPRRGRIVDRHGAPIADSRAVYNLGVTYSELELRGRGRRELPFWRFDERRFDAFVADLGGRMRWIGKPIPLRDAVVRELLAHPGVAVRSGAGAAQPALGLVAVPRHALAPAHAALAEDEGAFGLATLAESDLLSDDPRDALAREILARWSKEVTIVGEDEFQAACARFDREMLSADAPAPDSPGAERSITILDPFTPGFSLRVPAALTATGELTYVDLALRILAPERRAQAEATLARVLGEAQDLVHERLERALTSTRVRRPSSDLFYGASSNAEQIAPMLPEGQVVAEIPVGDVPGARERVLIVQGDPPDGEGLLTHVCRRIAANLGADPVLIQALVMRHADRVRAITCEREYRVHHMALDPDRLDRLANGLSRSLSEMGRPTSRLDVDAALARVRRSADKEWTGQTRFDALALIGDVPHTLAVRLQGGNAEPPRDVLKEYTDAGADLPGLVVQVDVGRAYPFPGSCCHILGMLGRSEQDREADERAGLIPGSLVGTSGLERLYDQQLRGVAGSRVRVRTPDGVRVLRDEAPQPGADVVTELDMEMQTLAEDSLDRYYELAKELGSASDKMERARKVGKGRAGFCLIDVRTGGLLTLASAPRFKLEDFRDHYQALDKDPAEPLLDHASTPSQAPGSSFKILTALAALEYAVTTPEEEIYCQGYMTMVRGKPVLRDHAPAGTYDLPHAIQVSSNVYFAILADRLAKRIGVGALPAYAEIFGFGRADAVDVWSERPGLLPSPDRAARHYLGRMRPAEPKWLPNDTWRMGIGQFATASPLQCAVIAAAVANGGHVVRPFLVRPQEGPPEVRDLNVRREWLDQVRRGMELVTENEPHATGRLLVLRGAAEGIKVAAKTGTAEWGSSDSRSAGRTPDHAWMIGYAPAEDPKVAFACFIHCGTFGGSACTPVVKRVLEAYFTRYGRAGHAAIATETVPAPAEDAAAPPAATPTVVEEEAGG